VVLLLLEVQEGRGLILHSGIFMGILDLLKRVDEHQIKVN
jgi:hypothetical protein